jgi:DDE family transposase
MRLSGQSPSQDANADALAKRERSGPTSASKVCTGKPARVFTEFGYRTRKSWSRKRRVVAKAERIEGKENPRYVVTSLSAAERKPRELHEQLYCARGEMENRIKEQMNLVAGRMSAETMRANQLRLYLSAMAYVLMEALRRLALTGTGMARAQVQTIRLRMLKIGTRIRFSVRRVLVSMSSSYAWQGLLAHAWAAMRC